MCGFGPPLLSSYLYFTIANGAKAKGYGSLCAWGEALSQAVGPQGFHVLAYDRV